MKKLAIFGALVIIAWSCKQESKEESDTSMAKSVKSYTIEQMMDNEAIGGGSFSPDNSKLLISSNRSGIYNMYTISTDSGEMEPITQSDSSSVFAISYFPRDERMLFRMDGNGDEIYHIYIRNLSGSFTDLTPTEGARASFHSWSEDKKSFFFTSNKRDSRFMTCTKWIFWTTDRNSCIKTMRATISGH
ncbi:hypothetical protein NYZ99_11315 [Maribacter litopenaei]|uniref:WD40-like Beta Propeller Repeat n=1 Tax=Maribacter litopenaei TaxID=2976127 RepID=A0ABY5Y6E9_9FLAO|nr:hypothetical protein [Maribacter litopenaei]UWX53735.1 hypothetical protein NYZ99_11315 [Maribacter litopenaei]